MIISPVVQKETGRVLAFQVYQGGRGLCFGKTTTEALTRAMTMLMVEAQGTQLAVRSGCPDCERGTCQA